MSRKRALGLAVATLVLFRVCSHQEHHAAAAEAASPRISNLRWIVPSTGLPPGATTLAANNNLALETFAGRLYLAFRSAPTHFASAATQLRVLSSGDEGRTWRLEHTIERGTDLREPHFLVMKDRLILHFMELGANPIAFEPGRALRLSRDASGGWSAVEPVPLPDRTMIWEIKVHDGLAFMTAYRGNHYSADAESAIDVYFKKSSDGLTWADVDPARPVVYRGGVSEVAFEFDAEGNLWAVTRNEDGDATGFGSHVAFAPAGDLGAWQFPAKCSPYRYDSPRMFRHGEDVYLVARRNIHYTADGAGDFVEAPYDLLGDRDRFLPFALRRGARLAAYSALPKKTSIYRIDRRTRAVVWQKDLPSAADTAFPAVVEAGPDRFLLANYSNPVGRGGFDWAPDSDPCPSACEGTERWSWIRGQTSRGCGTRIYLTTLTFP